MAGKHSENTDQISNVNEGHAGNNERYELIHGVMSETSNPGRAINFVMIKRHDGLNKSDKALKHPIGVNTSITFKLPSRPNKSNDVKEHSGKINKHLCGTKKPSNADIHNTVNHTNKH